MAESQVQSAPKGMDATTVGGNGPSLRGRSRRQPELDALRGLLLVWMTLTHLPTGASHYTNQPLGFVSAAEGFIFLSALLAGRVFGRVANESGLGVALKRLWARALRLYGYHLALLAIAFTAVAAAAVRTQRPSLQGLLDFYLAHPAHAVWSSALLVYKPPLLDILPMYILFLLATPLALAIGRRWGWLPVLAPSALLWLAAQFGLRAALHARVGTHWPGFAVPITALGSFDLFAWQGLWAFGLWLGAGAKECTVARLTSRRAVWAALAVAGVFFVLRHPPTPNDLDPGSFAPLFDKWHLGALRVLNFAALGTLFTAARPKLARWFAVQPLVLMGRASLEVFCAHLLLCFAALSLVGDGVGLPVIEQIALIGIALTTLYAVALWREQHDRDAKPRTKEGAAGVARPALAGGTAKTLPMGGVVGSVPGTHAV